MDYINECDTPAVMPDGYVYDWDGSSLRRARPVAGQRSVDAKTRRVYEYAYAPACWANRPPDENGNFGNDVSCNNAVSGPLCPPREFAMWTFRRLVGPPAAVRKALAADPDATAWTPRPVTCLGASEQWSLPELTRMAREHLEERVSRPDAVLEPPTGAIVNLPVIVHTEPADPVGFTVTRPLPGHLEATPSYRWNFGEGDPQAGPGLAYDGTSPTRTPDYYIAHPYTTTGPKQVTLQMTWTATFEVAGLTIPLEDIVFTDTANLTVRAARSILIDGT